MSECESRYEVALVIEMQDWVFWTPTHCATLGKWNGREQGVSRRLTCAHYNALDRMRTNRMPYLAKLTMIYREKTLQLPGILRSTVLYRSKLHLGLQAHGCRLHARLRVDYKPHKRLVQLHLNETVMQQPAVC